MVDPIIVLVFFPPGGLTWHMKNDVELITLKASDQADINYITNQTDEQNIAITCYISYIVTISK